MKTAFKKEWTDKEYKIVEKAILKLFKGTLLTQAGSRADVITHYVTNYNELDNILGLAYTSSGMYAVLGICNTNVFLDLDQKYKYEMFCISDQGIICAELWDEDENEIYIKIGQI